LKGFHEVVDCFNGVKAESNEMKKGQMELMVQSVLDCYIRIKGHDSVPYSRILQGSTDNTNQLQHLHSNSFNDLRCEMDSSLVEYLKWEELDPEIWKKLGVAD
jgi:hypothetical protein